MRSRNRLRRSVLSTFSMSTGRRCFAEAVKLRASGLLAVWPSLNSARNMGHAEILKVAKVEILDSTTRSNFSMRKEGQRGKAADMRGRLDRGLRLALKKKLGTTQ